jgi:3-hydroxyisobutyrate dehydrogenase
MRVGWIGLGAMGHPMAARVSTRFDTAVWNRTAAVAREHARAHGTRDAGLAAAAGADVVISCLSDMAAVAEVVRAASGLLCAGGVWVDCTSGEFAASRAVAADLAAAGVDYLDAPVSGMSQRARAGTLTMLVGGDPAVLERARPVLETLGTTIVHAGPVGCGHLLKAANNTLFAAGFWIAAEVAGMLAAGGVDLDAALAGINASSGRSFVTESFLAEFVTGRPENPSYRLGQNAHDVETLVRAAASAGAAPSLAAGVAERYRGLVAELGPGADARAAFDAIGRGV